jgi:hypothetical protein
MNKRANETKPTTEGFITFKISNVKIIDHEEL